MAGKVTTKKHTIKAFIFLERSRCDSDVYSKSEELEAEKRNRLSSVFCGSYSQRTETLASSASVFGGHFRCVIFLRAILKYLIS